MQRVLIVEDEHSMSVLLQSRFKREGLDVRAVSSAAEALELMASFVPELIVLDVKEPEGDASLWALRMNAAQDSVPVIVLSGSREDGVPTSGEPDERLVVQIRKPFRPSELLAIVRDYL